MGGEACNLLSLLIPLPPPTHPTALSVPSRPLPAPPPYLLNLIPFLSETPLSLSLLGFFFWGGGGGGVILSFSVFNLLPSPPHLRTSALPSQVNPFPCRRGVHTAADYDELLVNVQQQQRPGRIADEPAATGGNVASPQGRWSAISNTSITLCRETCSVNLAYVTYCPVQPTATKDHGSFVLFCYRQLNPSAKLDINSLLRSTPSCERIASLLRIHSRYQRFPLLNLK